MRIGSFLELIITLLVFFVIWILPRIIAARAADQKRKARSSPKSAPKPEQSWSKEIFSKLIDESFLDIQDNKPAQAAVPVNEPTDGAARTAPDVQQEEPASVFKEQEDARQQETRQEPVVPMTAAIPGSRRTPLQKALVWKELLEPPKALRHDPFP